MSISAVAPDARVQGVSLSDTFIEVTLRDGRKVSAPLNWFPKLLNATPGQRQRWEVSGAGHGIHWPEIDEDLSVEGLLRGHRAPG